MPRYLINEGWSHIFSGTRETTTRFAFNLETGIVDALQLRRDANGDWSDAETWEIEDFQDHLVNANPEAIERPTDWDLLETEDLPAWAQPVLAPTP